MKFQFDANQAYQLDAINAVVDLFDGQPADAVLTANIAESIEQDPTALISFEVGAVGNNLVLDNEVILDNLQRVQDRNGLEVSSALSQSGLDFDIEMETGTGKTYVYLRTIFELARRYNFTKFIILVPSVAIREGVNSSIRLMREHFRNLYAQPFDSTVYSGKNPETVQTFATSTNLQIMVMTVQSIAGDANNRVIHQERDKLNGLKPIQYLQATRPVVIMDEPQNMEAELTSSSIQELDSSFTLRYSATHKKQRNVVYRLDPVDAHELNLVKQIVVSEVEQKGASATPYIKLVSVKRDPKWVARLELMCRATHGSLEKKQVSAAQHANLFELSNGNPAYENNWRINAMSFEPEEIELTNHGFLRAGDSIGGNDQSVHREMIRETIREHLRKESQLRDQGIKVLSLFFVDHVSSYVTYESDGSITDGQFVTWFDELYEEERNKSDRYKELLPYSASEVRAAYFAESRTRSKTEFVDSSGKTEKDNDAYDLIMKNKELLLDLNTPERFIFSHSALQEGWDNPNVFQICVFRNITKTGERRQTIGRGLRLPVTQDGTRVSDKGVAQLTVVANESYQSFAQSLQSDYKSDGVSIGKIRLSEFAKIAKTDSEEFLGYKASVEIYDHLERTQFIVDGRVTDRFMPDTVGFALGLPEKYAAYEMEVIERLRQGTLEKFVKPASKRKARQLNKALYASPAFEEFWAAISKRTTYRVSLSTEDLIDATLSAIRKQPVIPALRVEVTQMGLKVKRGGVAVEQGNQATRVHELASSFNLPDIVTDLQDATSLTRHTIVEILTKCGRLAEFIGNPNDFTQMVKKCIQDELAHIVQSGIQYEQIAGSLYELRELQKDGAEAKERFLDQMYAVKNTAKTDFDYVVFDSDVERQFAEILDARDDIEMFMKLPAKFLIPTPVGDYNPDWAIVKNVDGKKKVYMIRETKSTLDKNLLRPTEKTKIECGIKHFKAIGIDGEVGDYEMAAPGHWNV
jgi:type III restriction enzyme